MQSSTPTRRTRLITSIVALGLAVMFGSSIMPHTAEAATTKTLPAVRTFLPVTITDDVTVIRHGSQITTIKVFNDICTTTDVRIISRFGNLKWHKRLTGRKTFRFHNTTVHHLPRVAPRSALITMRCIVPRGSTTHVEVIR